MATAIFTILNLPTGLEYGRKRLFDSIDLVSRHTARVQLLEEAGFSKAEIEDYLSKGGKLDDRLPKGRSVEHEPAETIRAKYYADLTHEEIMTQLHAKYFNRVDFAAVEAEYHKNMGRLRGDQIRFMLYAFIFWGITSVGLYGFGFSLGWIIRGFRQK
jgi:nitrate reductase NapE component